MSSPSPSPSPSKRHRSSIEDPLPPNLTLDILSRLPIKTILLCKSVSKKWYNLISHPYFTHLHLSRSPETLIFHKNLSFESPGSLIWLHSKTHFTPIKKLHLSRCPLILPDCLLLQQGSVNGLVCCRQKNDAVFILNPVLEQFLYIPPPRRMLGTISYGFGVSKTGEYKVVRVCVNVRHRVYDVSVYSLGTGKWRLLGKKLPYVHRWIQDVDPGVFVDGSLYWLLPDTEIYCFDLDSETFELVPFAPKSERNRKREMGLMLGVLKGRLSRIAWFKMGLEVWVMKEGGWCKEIEIREVVSRGIMWSDETEPLCVVDGVEGKSVLMMYNPERKEVVACCLETNTILDLGLRGDFSSFVLPYRPSFVRLDGFKSERVYPMQEEEMCPAFDEGSAEEDSDNLQESTDTTEVEGREDGKRDGNDFDLEKGEVEQDHSCGENVVADQADESEDLSELESEMSDDMFDSDDEMFDSDDDDDSYDDYDDDSDDDSDDDYDDIEVLKNIFWPRSDNEDDEDEGVVDGCKNANDGEGKEDVTSDACENAK